MSREFSGSAQYLDYANSIITATPFTIGTWLYPDNNSTWQMIVASNQAGAAIYYIHLAINSTAIQFAYRGSLAGNTTSIDTSASTLAQNQWQHICGVAVSDSVANVFIDGGNKATQSSGTFDGFGGNLDHVYLAARNVSGVGDYLNGRLANTAMWNAALSDAEVAVLADGYSPLLVRPESLIAYWPLIGKTSPEIDVVGGYNLSLNGAPAAWNHPAVRMASMPASGSPAHPFLTSLLTLKPHQSVPTTSNYAELGVRNRHLTINFDDTTNQSRVFDFIMPQHFTGVDVGVILHFSAATATSGYAKVGASFERVGDGQQDVDSDSFASVNNRTVLVPATSGYVKQFRVRFNTGADMDSVDAGEKCRLKITRLADDSADDMSGDLELHLVEIRGA